MYCSWRNIHMVERRTSQYVSCFWAQSADSVPAERSFMVRSCTRLLNPPSFIFGTPVALISTLNPDGSPNLAPMSSAWWLGWSCMLGLGQMGQTSVNLIRTRECVINLPSEDLVTQVDRLALTTGRNPVPDLKRQWGYRHEPDKFGIAGFTADASQSVAPPRVHECPVQMEGIVHEYRPFGKN